MKHRLRLAGAIAGIALGVAAPALANGYSNWTGFYAGIGFGAQETGIDWNTASITLDSGAAFANPFPDSPTRRDYGSTGLQFHGFLGYNVQMQGVVVGIEASIAGAGDSASKTLQVFPGANDLFGPGIPNTFDSIKAQSGFGGTIKGRIGALIRKDLMLYGLGGIAFQEFGFHADCNGSPVLPSSSLCFQINHVKQTVTKTGFVIGAGFEAKLTENWFARLEYTYAGFGDTDLTFKFPDSSGFNNATTMKAKVDLDLQTATVGVGYKF